MSDSYRSKYDQRHSQNSFVDATQSGGKQEFRAIQNNYAPEQKQTLAEAAAEIQRLLKQLEETNPNATDTEKAAFVKLSMPANTRQRLVSALQAGGKEALKEFLDNPYLTLPDLKVRGFLG
ncbi:MAG: hypothetical protein F6K36_21060 [Symploca sp. SIO3C6]|nr:hypothetical protein [Symploca sp. SIO3C6]